MEIAADSRMPTYSGGLGILAGDALRSCADLKVPSVAVTLLCEKGYFYQKIEENGSQRELPVQWQPIEGRMVAIRYHRHNGMLRALGYNELKKYHMNEGHASLLVLELLRERRIKEEDGWWIEGHIEGVTGWSIGPKTGEAENSDRETLEIYNKLGNVILP